MSLTDAAIRNAKPKSKPYKLSDAGGLFLWVQPSGGKWWRYKYRFAGKEKALALGSYPDVGLAEAPTSCTGTQGTGFWERSRRGQKGSEAACSS